MQPNLFPDIAELINTAQHPILILVQSEGCENAKTNLQLELEKILEAHPDPVVFYTMCIPDHLMAFPRAATPIVYYFLPGNQQPLFWQQGFAPQIIEKDLETLKKMMTGMTYEQAVFTPEQLEQVLRVDYLLEKEKETIHSFPSTFQQARNLAKEIWKSGKRAAQGLPVIVSAEEGFKRFSACESCEHLDKQSYRCSQCGCFMKTKTQIASASCPLNKWSAIV